MSRTDDSRSSATAVTMVTGGGTGIGAAVALRAAAAGHRVVICGRRLGPLEAVAAQAVSTGELPGAIEAMVADVTLESSVSELVTSTLSRYGRLDHVVANAGVMRSGTVLDTDPAEWEAVVRGNLTSAYLLLRATLPALVESSGSLVAVSSIAGLRASAGAAAYATTKAALTMLMRTVAVDFGPRGVRANVVCPGWVRTEMADEEMAGFGAPIGLDREQAYREITQLVPQRRAASPDEVAAAVLWLLGREASYVNGAVLTVDGGTTIVDPGTVPFDYAVTPR